MTFSAKIINILYIKPTFLRGFKNIKLIDIKLIKLDFEIIS